MSKATLFAASVAIGAATLGLLALGAASLGVTGLRIPGLALLGVGGLIAAVIRWSASKNELDGEAVAQLAIAGAELERGNPTGAGWAASKAAAAAATSRTRNRALTTLAWAALGQGYPERAKAALEQISPSYSVDLYCLAAVEAACGATELAIQALEVARTAGVLTSDSAKLLVECHLRAFGMERAVLAAIQIRKILGRENCELVVNAARLADAHAAAATLAAALRDEADGKGGPSLPGQSPPISSRSAAPRHG